MFECQQYGDMAQRKCVWDVITLDNQTSFDDLTLL